MKKKEKWVFTFDKYNPHLPNPWHAEQKRRGGRVHEKKKGKIFRKEKYKNLDY